MGWRRRGCYCSCLIGLLSASFSGVTSASLYCFSLHRGIPGIPLHFFFFGWWVIPLMPVMAPCTLQLGFSSLLCAVVWLYRQEFQVLRHRARTCKLNWIFSFPLKVLLSCWIVRFFLAGQFFFFFKSVSVFLFTLKKSRPWIFTYKKIFNLALSSLIINKWSCCF